MPVNSLGNHSVVNLSLALWQLSICLATTTEITDSMPVQTWSFGYFIGRWSFHSCSIKVPNLNKMKVFILQEN